MMKKIIVTGANGQLGKELQDLSSKFPEYTFYFFSRAELDIADINQVENIFNKIQPSCCINCAAYTAVDKAESESAAAFRINADGVKNLAEASVQHQTKLIHISTDYVFDGSNSDPYKEDHTTGPINVYGASKLKGEELCKQANPASIIIRTSWVYSTHGNNFVKTMVRLMEAKPELKVVDDQWGSPTYAADIAEAIMHIIQSNSWLPGIYHFSNDGVTNWYEFAKEIKESIQSSCLVLPIPTEQYPTPARRPQYSILDKEKIKTKYNIQLVPWKKSLHNCLNKLVCL